MIVLRIDRARRIISRSAQRIRGFDFHSRHTRIRVRTHARTQSDRITEERVLFHDDERPRISVLTYFGRSRPVSHLRCKRLNRC